MRNNKLLAIIAIFAMLYMTASNVFAATISNITVWGPDTQNVNLDWNETYPVWDITGSAQNIKVKARIEPTLNMSLSASEIDLGLLTPWVAETWTIDIEVGTNAKNGVVVTVQSTNWALVNTADNTTELSSIYKYSSTNQNTGAALDSTLAGFAVSNTLAEVDVDTNVHTIYETNKPENNDDTVKDLQFWVSVEANSQSQAWEYEDLLTFTITGRF